jgi:AcrR family transcriptional regulator
MIMDDLMHNIKFIINDTIFLRDPEATDLGKKILKYGVLLIHQMGFESFTFKKLAREANCTEGTIYRYFENKHKFLIYILSWYWNWLEYILVFSTNNISSPTSKLKIAIGILANPISKEDPTFKHINEIALHNIVISESSKAYLTKEIERDNREGYFMSYNSLSQRFAQLIKEINPNYPYPASLSSMIIEGAHQQKFFAQHLPTLSDAKKDDYGTITEFLTDMVLKTISR